MAGDDFDRRLERLILDPDSIDALWVKVSSPLLRLFGVKAQVETQHIGAWVRAACALEERADASKLRKLAYDEFEGNLRSLERAHQVYGEVDPRLVNWLVRLKLLLDQTARLAGAGARGERDWNRTKAERRTLELAAQRGLSTLEATPGNEPTKLESVEVLLDAARDERDFLGRRRHLLEAARELLLDAAAKVKHGEGVRARLEHITREIGELDRLEAFGVRGDVSLVHQLAAARAERATQRVHAILSTLEAHALSAGDSRVAELTSSALEQLWQGRDRFAREHQLGSLERSGRQTFQPEVLEAARRGMVRAREHFETTKDHPQIKSLGNYFQRIATSYLEKAPETELIQSALYVDGCVDVGGVLSPHRVYEPLKVVREVRYPTQQLTLAQARGVEDLKDAIISDPRMVMLDLATDRLTTRRYLGEQTRHIERRVLASEVRIFLLDGSGSMLGPRARMRDAIVVAELSTMIARLQDSSRWLTPTLYYRYFNQHLGEVVKVSTAAEAIQAIEDVLGEFRHGGTDIEGALLGSFETLRLAQSGAEDELARAQIVLITDGDARVNEQKLLEAREAVTGVPIGVSIIALGEENPALRALAMRQRERGERVFYQFLDDALLTRLVNGEPSSLALHLPDELAREAPGPALEALLDEIAAVQRVRDEDALVRARDESAALAEVGLTLHDLSKSEQARSLTLSRDAETLERRFERWFPRPSSVARASSLELRPSEGDSAAIAHIRALLFAVVEVLELLEGEPHRARADAIEMFERLLMERRLSFVHYRKLCARYPGVFDEPLTRLYEALGSRQET